MAKWPHSHWLRSAQALRPVRTLLVLAIALTGCLNPYGRPTLSPGGDVAIPRKTTPTEAIVGAILCSKGVRQDTSSVALTKPCDPLARSDTTPKPAALPPRKP